MAQKILTCARFRMNEFGDITIQGLESTPLLNGCHGRIVGQKGDRFVVKLEVGQVCLDISVLHSFFNNKVYSHPTAIKQLIHLFQTIAVKRENFVECSQRARKDSVIAKLIPVRAYLTLNFSIISAKHRAYSIPQTIRCRKTSHPTPQPAAPARGVPPAQCAQPSSRPPSPTSCRSRPNTPHQPPPGRNTARPQRPPWP